MNILKQAVPLVSVVIPVYNVQEYLLTCIESVITQTYKNIEIILVDDGSTDCSGALCDELANMHDEIKVFHKKNGGLSDARNIGIRQAKGDYLILLDSDDWFASDDLILNMVTTALTTDAEIVICNTVVGNNSEEKIKLRETAASPFIMNRVEGMKHLLYTDVFKFCAWGKLYKRELFNGVSYPIGKCYEDYATTYKLFNKVKKSAYISQVYYGYRVRESSIMSKPVELYLFDMSKDVLDDIAQICPEAINAGICSHCHQVFCVLTQNYEKLEKEKRKVLIKELKQYSNVVLMDSKVDIIFKIKMILAILVPQITSMIRKKVAKAR